MFQFAPAFANASFQKVAFDGSLEEFFWNGDQYAVERFPVICHVDVTEWTDTAVTTTGKKSFNGFLAAQSFLFRKSIRCLPVHFETCFYLERNTSSAFATDGISGVGAEISMVSPASFIAATIDLPYEMNFTFSCLNSGWFS